MSVAVPSIRCLTLCFVAVRKENQDILIRLQGPSHGLNTTVPPTDTGLDPTQSWGLHDAKTTPASPFFTYELRYRLACTPAAARERDVLKAIFSLESGLRVAVWPAFGFLSTFTVPLLYGSHRLRFMSCESPLFLVTEPRFLSCSIYVSSSLSKIPSHLLIHIQQRLHRWDFSLSSSMTRVDLPLCFSSPSRVLPLPLWLVSFRRYKFLVRIFGMGSEILVNDWLWQ